MANIVRLARRLTSLGNQCTFRTIYNPFVRDLSKNNVHLLDDASTKYLLRDYIPFTQTHKEKSAAILSRLHTLSPSTAQHFLLKSDKVADLKLRLYSNRVSDAPAERSYICLSYRWPVGNRDLRRTPEMNGKCELPTSAIRFQAVLGELESREEGLWVDQICIDQDNEIERNTTIGAMDLIYKSARAVIIALDDIEISRSEAVLLQAYVDNPYGLIRVSASVKSYHSGNHHAADPGRLLHGLLDKISTSEYFERAWCQHELRIGRDHVFLIRCSCSNVPGTRRVLRFTGSFLYYIFLLYAQDSPVGSYRSGFGRTVHSVFLKLHGEGPIKNEVEWQTTERPKSFESYVHSMAEVFSSKAGGNPALPTQELRDCDANRDKMSIVLNTVDSGLVLQQDSGEVGDGHPATLHECYKDMMLTALAAGDPVALCTTGQQLILEKDSPSWLCWPHNGDLDRKHFLPVPQIPITFHVSVDPSPACQFVELDLHFISSANKHVLTNSVYFDALLDEAKSFLQECFAYKLGDSAPYWISWNKDPGNSHHSVLQAHTLAYAFEGGFECFMSLSKCRTSCGDLEMRGALSQIFD